MTRHFRQHHSVGDTSLQRAAFCGKWYGTPYSCILLDWTLWYDSLTLYFEDYSSSLSTNYPLSGTHIVLFPLDLDLFHINWCIFLTWWPVLNLTTAHPFFVGKYSVVSQGRHFCHVNVDSFGRVFVCDFNWRKMLGFTKQNYHWVLFAKQNYHSVLFTKQNYHSVLFTKQNYHSVLFTKQNYHSVLFTVQNYHSVLFTKQNYHSVLSSLHRSVVSCLSTAVQPLAFPKFSPQYSRLTFHSY